MCTNQICTLNIFTRLRADDVSAEYSSEGPLYDPITAGFQAERQTEVEPDPLEDA